MVTCPDQSVQAPTTVPVRASGVWLVTSPIDSGDGAEPHPMLAKRNAAGNRAREPILVRLFIVRSFPRAYRVLHVPDPPFQGVQSDGTMFKCTEQDLFRAHHFEV